MDLVERKTYSKTKKETADIGVRAGYVGAPATPSLHELKPPLLCVTERE
jgi:hypothetical protein